MQAIDSFIQNRAFERPLSPCPQQDIDQLCADLAMQLPPHYLYLISEYGLLRSANVMNSTISLSSTINSAIDFLSLTDVAQLTLLYRQLGLPQTLFVFASDDHGQLYCLNGEGKEVDDTVFLFNSHDFSCTATEQPFCQWLNKTLT
ncbi:SMI1/KNR4 family protein [Paraferrimonas sp. SM1919]|uniref:SMI1/KNR4 family protein n=1 Tax=Paraferrimonas sp. SM1919 TaxID=2662263 RepID=UPI0013D4714B|nr:SMI1/KNR4 family protein [Paraferrimonas sp. SM1919]